MSQERCVSVERDECRPAGNTFIRRRSPNSCTYQQNIAGTPELFNRNLQNGIPSYAVCDFGVDRREREETEPGTRNVAVRLFQMENLPNELLEEFEEPSFYDIPPNASFEEVMCTMATPPAVQQKATSATPSEKLDELRAEVAQVVEINDLRKRMAAHIGSSAVKEPKRTVQIDDVRKRVAALISESSSQPSFCPIKIPPLPEDIYAIPPPPKNPKDVAAIIRRAKAIARLKEYEEAKAGANAPKGAIKKGVTVSKKLRVSRLQKPAVGLQKIVKISEPGFQKSAVTVQKPLSKTTAPSQLLKKGDTGKYGVKCIKKKTEYQATPQRPPDYVPEEWAAAILRTRKLAGLKTTNPKLVAKPRKPSTVPAKSPVRAPSAEKPPPPTFESVMQRAAAIRAKTNLAKARVIGQEIPARIAGSPTIEDELEDFEALEELYGFTSGGPCPVTEETPITLQNRIEALEQQLLQTPTQGERQEEFDEFEQVCGADALQHQHLELPNQIFEVPSILRYEDLLNRRESLAAAAAQAALMKKIAEEVTEEYADDYEIPIRPAPTTPLSLHRPLSRSRPVSKLGTHIRSLTPVHSTTPRSKVTCPAGFNDAILEDIDIPDFDIADISAFAFSEEALADAGFIVGDESLGEISMPDFDTDVSFDEYGIENVSSPDLCDLSISGTELALEPDYPLETSTEEDEVAMDQIVEEEPKQSGFLTALVTAVVDTVKNIFSPGKSNDDQFGEEKEDELNLNSSLPNMFDTIPTTLPKPPPPDRAVCDPIQMVEKSKSLGKSNDDQFREEREDELNFNSSLPNMFNTTPTTLPKPPPPERAVCGPVQMLEKSKSPERSIVIPSPPKNPKDYRAIIMRARAIQKKKAQEAAAAPAAPTLKEKKGKREIKSTIPRRTPLLSKKAPPPAKKPLNPTKGKQEKKVYLPGQYSPSAVRAVARARSLAGLKNVSDLLNPERTAKMAELKAAQEAELAAIEALPPVERMRKKIEKFKKCLVPSTQMPRPSIEMLGALEAIRASLPVALVSKKWRPAKRYRCDRRVKKKDSIFRKDFGRVLVPTERNQKTKNWRPISVMSPIVEEPVAKPQNLMQFSPLKPHEGQLRLRYLKEQAARKLAETLRAAEDAQAAISLENFPQPDVPSDTFGCPEAPHFSPLQLQNFNSPCSEETRRERIITQIGPNGGEETIREEVTETSTIENGELHTSTRQVTTKTDEYGNVTCHVQEGKGLSDEEAMPEDLENIEPPDFLDTSNILTPGDPSIPTPAEIIERIRTKVQQKINFALPDMPNKPRSPIPSSPGTIEFPEDLPEEDLCETETPDFAITPQKASPPSKTLTPIEKDSRMYAWGERLPPTPLVCPKTPKSTPQPPQPVENISPTLKPKSSEQIIIPPHPKDPKDYIAMIKRAQAIQKLQKQQEKLETCKTGRVPLSRWVGPPLKDPKRKPRKRLVMKKRVPKTSSKKQVVEKVEEEDREIADELPELSQEYRDAVARARLLHGLKNRTAALNPEIAAKLAAKKATEEAEIAAFESLSEYEKIIKRMEKIRNISPEKRIIKPSSDILGAIAAIRANMPPIEETEPSSPVQTPAVIDVSSPSPQQLCEEGYTPHISPRPDEQPGFMYYDAMQDFRVPKENVLETSLLMPKTPPRNLREKFERLKRAQERRIYQEYSQVEVSPAPAVKLSPIQLFSPSDAPCEVSEQKSVVANTSKGELLIDIDAAPQRQVSVRQFRDLEDMPFDDLEFELEPSLPDVSLEEPMSPPPRPLDIITRIRYRVQQDLRERAQRSPVQSPVMLEMPRDLPEEELLEISAPSYACTPSMTPSAKERSPRISFPMAWGEVRQQTPKSPTPRKPSPIKTLTPLPAQIIKEKLSSPVSQLQESPIIIPPHPKDPKDYVAMLRRAKAIQKLREQEADKIANAPPSEPAKTKGRVPISRWVSPLPKKICAKPRKKLVLRKRVQPEKEGAERGISAEPSQLPQEYRDAVARARLLRGLKNRTAALNPKYAAKLAAKKAAEEAAAAEFAALSEYEKVKKRMERLRKKRGRRLAAKPTMEQLAYLEALKQTGAYQISVPPSPKYPQRIEELEQMLEAERMPQTGDVSLAEFEALEAIEAPNVCPYQPDVTALDMEQVISGSQQKLATPPRMNPKERYQQLLAQRKATPPTPAISPVKTPNICYSPLTLATSPLRNERIKRAEKSTTKITKSGDNTIKKQVIETSEIINGELQHLITHVTTTTDSQGNVTCEINESKRVSARDSSAELRDLENLEDIEEPSFLDTTPVTPVECPRPRDIIEKVRKQLKENYRPEVPTGNLIDLRTPPRMLSLPEDVTQEQLLDLTLPDFERTPTKTPVRTPTMSPIRALDVSLPHLFNVTPPPSMSPLRRRMPSPEGPIVIPPDPADFKDICRRARLIKKNKAQEEDELLAEKEAAAAAEVLAAAQGAKPKKKERVPISRWTAPPPKKLGKRKKLVMRKRGEAIVEKTRGEKLLTSEEVECAKEPPSLPENYAIEVARARILAGLKNRTAALNPHVAAREAARKAKETEDAGITALNVPPHSPIRDYATLLSRMAAMKEKGFVPRGQLSLASAAYLNAVKSALQIQQQHRPVCPENEGATYESPRARFKRIIAERTNVPPPNPESPARTPPREDINYSPLRFVSPHTQNESISTAEAVDDRKFVMPDFGTQQELEDLEEIEQPSYMDVSQYPLGEDVCMPLTPPPSPPPQPDEIIKRIRNKYQQERAIGTSESSSFIPAPLEFPEELTTEELFEVSAPSLAQSPTLTETLISSPNISIPQYFEKTPSIRSISPTRCEVVKQHTPQLLGSCPGVRVKTPEGPIIIPPHPKDPTDIAAMIKRSQLIHKLKARESAEKAAAGKSAKNRIPISRSVVAPTTAKTTRAIPPKKGRLFQRLVLKKNAPAMSSTNQCSTNTQELPADYVAQVGRARRLAGLKSKTALPNAENEALAAQPSATSSDYARIMERVAALRTTNDLMQKGPTARELTTRQHLINQQQRHERQKLLQQLEVLRSQQGFQEPIDFAQSKTPPRAKERLQAIKERIQTENPKPAQYPYSPVKTPEIVNVPAYQPITLHKTPPYPFLENAYIPEIEDISMQFEEYDDYDTIDEADVEDYEFQIAEAAAARTTSSKMEYEPQIQTAQNAVQTEFDMARKIKMLENQLKDEENLELQINKAEAAAVCPETNRNYKGNRIEILENILLQPAFQKPHSSRSADVAQERYNVAQRINILQQPLLQAPAHTEQNPCPEVCQYVEEEDEQYDQHNLDDAMMDDFEAMERECM